MQKGINTSIVIVSWNGAGLLKECLASLNKQTLQEFDVILVDNGSVDNSLDIYSQLCPKGQLIQNKKNLGFAQANNQGIDLALSASDVKFVVCLNNDTIQDKDWLKNLIAYMTTHPKVGSAQGLVLSYKNHKIVDSTGVFLDTGYIPHQRGFETEKEDTQIPIIGPSATASVYSRNALEATRERSGYFDKSFFAYVEDVDLALRIKLRGFETAYVKSAIVYHHGSATGKKVSSKKMYWGARNLILLLSKNVPLRVEWRYKKPIIKSHLANLQFLWKSEKLLFWAYSLGNLVGVIKSILYLPKRYHNLYSYKMHIVNWADFLVSTNPQVTTLKQKLKKALKR